MSLFLRTLLVVSAKVHHRFLAFLWIVARIAIVLLSVWVILVKLQEYRYDIEDFFVDVSTMRFLPVAVSIIAIACDYLLQTEFDVLALRFLKKRLSLGPVRRAAFIGQATTVGGNVFIGGTVRLRLYHHLGLTADEVASIVTFSFSTFILGFLTLSGIVFLLEPVQVPASWHVPLEIAQNFGVICDALLLLLLAASTMQIQIVRLYKWTLKVPQLSITFRQILFSTASWLCSAFALFALLPSPPLALFPIFLGMFLIALFLGQISQAPAGLGVFEAAMLVMLSSIVSVPVLGALIVYRFLYYVLPLLVALLLLGLDEAKRLARRVL